MTGYLRLFFSFFKIGLFSFGGGYAMLPLIYQEIEVFGLSMKEFSDVVAISQMTPGPIAVNAATYVGYRSAGFLGSAFATFGVSLPSFVLITIIASIFNKFKSNTAVQSALEGIRPATVGMIASAIVFFANTSIIDISLIGEGFWKIFSLPSIAIFAFTIVGSRFLKLGPILLTLIGGILGVILL
jgi:chromate transporter